MGKAEAKNLDLKSKLSIVSGTIANAKKDIESFKNEFNDFKSDHAMSKKGLNSLNNEFYDYLIMSLKVNDNLVKLNNDILMIKNEYYFNIRNKSLIINSDTLISKTNCIKLKSVVRENINSLKNIKNNLYNVKKDNNSLSIDLKKLKEEYINKSNKSVKARSIFINIKANRFNKRFDRFINKSSLKTNACTIKDSAIFKNHVDAFTSKNDLIVKNYADACTSKNDLIAKNYVNACTSTDDLIVKNHVDACTNTDDLVKSNADACTNTDDLVKNHVDACTNTDDVCTNENKNENENENEPSTNENENKPCINNDDSEDDSDDDDSDSDSDSDDDGDDDSNDKPGTSGNNNNEPGTSGNNDNKPGTSSNENNNDNKPSKNDNKPVNNDNEKSHQISPSELFSNNIAKIIKLNDEIYDDDEWLAFMQLNKINSLLDELIDHVWLTIYNKNREKNEIINIDIDKDKDIEGYVNIYKKIIDDKFEFVNKIVELHNDAIDKKEFNNLKDDVLKLIGNSCICDVERNDSKKDNNKKDSDAKRKGRKKDNSKNVNKDKDNDNLIGKLLNNKDKLHNFNDKVLNNLTNIDKLKEKILINKKEAGELNVPIKNIRLKHDNYKKTNILYDDLINRVWRMIYVKNRVNNEMDNIDCNIAEDARTYLNKYIKIVSDKQVLIYSVSGSIDELIEGLDANTSNDIGIKEIKDFKKAVIELIDKFLSYIKLETKKKGTEKKDTEKKDIEKKDIEKKDIEKKGTKKKDTAKEHIEKVDAKKNSEHDANNKPATNADIKAHR